MISYTSGGQSYSLHRDDISFDGLSRLFCRVQDGRLGRSSLDVTHLFLHGGVECRDRYRCERISLSGAYRPTELPSTHQHLGPYFLRLPT
jgi:hypothetical protein